MAAYTATNWTIAFDSTATKTMDSRYAATTIRGKERHVNLKLTLPEGGTIPAGGVPLPTYYRVGMVRYVGRYILRNSETTNFTTARYKALHWVMNTTGKKLVCYRYTLASSTAAASGGRAIRSATAAPAVTCSGSNVFYVTAVGW